MYFTYCYSLAYFFRICFRKFKIAFVLNTGFSTRLAKCAEVYFSNRYHTF